MAQEKSSALLQHYIATFGLAQVLNADLLRCLKVFRLPAYTPLYIEQDEQHYLYFLVEGQVQVHRYHPNGKLAVIALMTPFALIGDVELFSEQPSATNVSTTQPSVLLGIERVFAQRYGGNDPRFLHFLIQHLTSKLYQTTLLHTGHVLPLVSRFASYLLAQRPNRDGWINLPPKTDLAALLGCTPRHLNRVLNQLIQSGCLMSQYPLVQILDRIRLQSFVETSA